MNKFSHLSLTLLTNAVLLVVLGSCQRQELPAPISPSPASAHSADAVATPGGDVTTNNLITLPGKTPPPPPGSIDLGGPTGGGGGNGGGDGGRSGGDPGGSSGTASTLSIDKSQLVPCEGKVLTNLQATTGAGLYSILKLFSGNISGYNWKVKNGNLSSGTYGSTDQYNRATGAVTTTFDSNQWRDATDLSIARTMLHEEIHAYLVSYFANDPVYANATFSTFVDAWKVAPVGADANIYHHNEMAEGWVGDVAWALKRYGISQGYNLSDQFYSDMAWAGLEGTALFKAKPASEQIRIHNTIQTEINGTDSNGYSRPQSGRRAGC